MVYSCNEIYPLLIYLRHRWISKYYAEWKKSYTKDYILYDSIYITCSYFCLFVLCADIVPGCSTGKNLAEGLGWKQHTVTIITTIIECLRAWHYPTIWILLLFYGWENWASDRAYDLPKATQKISTLAKFISSSRLSSFQSSRVSPWGCFCQEEDIGNAGREISLDSLPGGGEEEQEGEY